MIKIPFSLHRKQRPIQEIITEFGDYLEEHCNTSSETSEYHHHLALKDPSSLVGKKILHKFIAEDSGKEIWYNGDVIDYNHDEKCHVIKYQGEDQLQHFNLIEGGDLVIDLTQYHNSMSHACIISNPVQFFILSYNYLQS